MQVKLYIEDFYKDLPDIRLMGAELTYSIISITNGKFAAMCVLTEAQKIFFVIKSASSIIFDISLTLAQLSPIIPPQKFKSFEF